MPKFINSYFGRLVRIEGSDIDRSLARLVGGYGRIEVHKSDIQHPGLMFIRFYYNLRSDNADVIDGIEITGCGEARFNGNMLTLSEAEPDGATYTFEVEISRYVGKLIGYECRDGDEDPSCELERLGYVEFIESDIEHPGLVSVRYFFNLEGEFDYKEEEPDAATHYIFNGYGALDINRNIFTLLALPTCSKYVFEMKCGG